VSIVNGWKKSKRFLSTNGSILKECGIFLFFAGFCFVVKCEKDLQFNPHPNRYWQLRRGSNAWHDGTCCNLEPKNIREALGAHKQKDVLKRSEDDVVHMNSHKKVMKMFL